MKKISVYSYEIVDAPRQNSLLASIMKYVKLNLTQIKSIPTRNYLSTRLLKNKFSIIESCLKRMDLSYADLFWFCDDLEVHNQMQLWAEWKGSSEIEGMFEKEEIEAIVDAENILNSAPVAIHESLRVFCHF